MGVRQSSSAWPLPPKGLVAKEGRERGPKPFRRYHPLLDGRHLRAVSHPKWVNCVHVSQNGASLFRRRGGWVGSCVPARPKCSKFWLNIVRSFSSSQLASAVKCGDFLVARSDPVPSPASILSSDRARAILAFAWWASPRGYSGARKHVVIGRRLWQATRTRF